MHSRTSEVAAWLCSLPAQQKVGWNLARARVKPWGGGAVDRKQPEVLGGEEMRPLSSGSVTYRCP